MCSITWTNFQCTINVKISIGIAIREYIYRQLRNAEPPDEETARGIIDKLFFSDKRYDLGDVGRYRINKKLNLTTDENIRVLTKEDIISIIKHLIELANSKTEVDDIDHLSNPFEPPIYPRPHMKSWVYNEIGNIQQITPFNLV